MQREHMEVLSESHITSRSCNTMEKDVPSWDWPGEYRVRIILGDKNMSYPPWHDQVDTWCCRLLNTNFGISFHGKMVVVGSSVVVVVMVVVISMHWSSLAIVGLINSILIVKRYRNETKTYLKPKQHITSFGSIPSILCWPTWLSWALEKPRKMYVQLVIMNKWKMNVPVLERH